MCKDSAINEMAPNVHSVTQGQMSPVATPNSGSPPAPVGVSLSPVQVGLPVSQATFCQQVPATQTQTVTVTPDGLTVFTAPGTMGLAPAAPYLSPPLSGSPPQVGLLSPEMSPYGHFGFPGLVQQVPQGNFIQLMPVGIGAAPGVLAQPPQPQPQPQSQTPPAQPGTVAHQYCSQKMEVVWHSEFQRLFSTLAPTNWQLIPTMDPPQTNNNNINWYRFQDAAKVRFCCSKCGKGWTSMKGRVAFWFGVDETQNAGFVMFKLYGQVCERCKDGLEHSMWYPEEVVKVVNNIYCKVGQVYYGFQQPKLRIDRRPGKPRSNHNSQLCQACKDGMCMGAKQDTSGSA